MMRGLRRAVWSTVAVLALALTAAGVRGAELEDVLDAARAARGDAGAWEDASMVRVEGAYNHFGREKRLSVWRRLADGAFRMERTFEGATDLFVGGEGQVWLRRGGEERVAELTPEQAAGVRAQVEAMTPVGDPWNGAVELELAGLEETDSGPALHLSAREGAEGPVADWYLDPESHRVVQAVRQLPSDEGTLSLEIFYFDYRPADGGAVLPHTIEMDFGSNYSVLYVDSWELAPEAPEELFEAP